LSLVVVAAYLINPSFVESINNKATDAIFSFSGTTTASGSVLIVDIDDTSLAKYGQWPWPRYRLAKLLQKINGLGAGSIGLDLILSEADRTSPGNWQSTITRDLGCKIDMSAVTPGLADYDRYLAETLSKGPYILGYEFLFADNKWLKPCGLHPLNTLWVNTRNAELIKSGLFAAQGVVCNRTLFSNAVSYSGFLNATPDSDGILRRIPILIQFEGKLFPSFALAALMQSGKITQIQIVQRKSGLLDIVVGGAVIPIDRQGNVTINFGSGSGAVQRVSAADLMDVDSRVPAARLKNKIVLVGSSASGLGKIYQTPALKVYSDVELHARLLENLLTGRVAVRSGDFIPWEALAGLLAAVLVCILITRMEILSSGLIATASIIGFWTGAVVLFQRTGLLFSPLLPTSLVVLNYTVLTILKSWKNQQYSKHQADDALLLLKTSENTLNSIIKSVPDIIFRLDSNGRITFISPAISKFTDSPDRLMGHQIFDLVAPDDLDKARHRLNEKRTGERATYGLEIRLLLPHHQDGNVEDMGCFSVSAEGIYCGDTPAASNFIGTQGIMRDITEQKKLEERLLRAQKMEAVGNLAAGVAHDLNNILCGLVAYPELLLLELPEGSPLRDKIAAIQKTGQKAAEIVEDLLSLARRGAKVSEIVNLNRVISDYLASPEFAKTRQCHPSITFEADLAPDLMNTMGSRVQFSKTIMNILNNAAEAMPAGGTIRISSYNICLDTPLDLYETIPAGEYVCAGVVDEGVGIAREDLQRIFEPFYSKKSMKRSGSGLGMTVIWATIKDYNGYIDVQSREGEGTRIILYLPSTRENEETNPRRMGLEEYLGTEEVLVVDDMPEQAEIATKMLAKLGYKVTSVASGEEAVESIRRKKPDLVVLDMIMPGGMDGLDTYRRISEISPGQRVVITSGFSESERVRTAQQLGAGSYIRKPYTMEKFGVAVRRELDKGNQRSA
jgi:two-component system, cell cycle sensor histidine kinase and response regulator CckA